MPTSYTTDDIGEESVVIKALENEMRQVTNLTEVADCIKHPCVTDN